MKQTWMRILLFLLCGALFFSGMTLAPAASTPESRNVQPIYYCREALATLNNAAALQYAYDQIVAGVEVSAESIEVYDGTNAITRDELKIVFDAYRRDHTEQFWLGNSYSVSYTEQSVISIAPEYMMSGETLKNAKLLFEQVLSNTVAQVADMQDEYEIEKYLHDRLAVGVTYVESANAHNAYGALVEGKAVCEGYAEALQCLLHRAGIQSLIVLGSSINPSTGISENHAWNMVRINGKYYHTDLTWNDQESTLFYAYFNQTDSVITEDHVITPTAYALPACNDIAANYFVKNGNVIGSDYTVDSVAELLLQNGLAASVYVMGDADAFLQWFYQNVVAIAGKAGVSGAFSYGFSQMGRELLLHIDTCKHTSLTEIKAKPVNCTEDGNTAYYTCTCGRWFSDAAAKDEIVNHESVKILSVGHQWTVRVEDEAHLRQSASNCRETGSYWLECATCHGISDEKYFESTQYGSHVYGTEWQKGDENGHWHKCTYCDAYDTPTAHTPGAPATTEAPQLCTDCGYELAPVIHVHDLKEVASVQAACEKDGKKGYYLCACGAAFEDAEGTVEILALDAWGIIPALSHVDEDGDGVCDTCNDVSGMFGLPVTKQTLIYIAAGGGVLLLLIIIVAATKRRR